jgi:nuclear cap-binding protein subunit 1
MLASASEEQTAELNAKVAELLEKTDIIASTSSALEALVDPYPAPEEQQDKTPMTCASVISLLQAQLGNEQSTEWKLTCIPRVFHYTPKVSAQQDGLEEDGNGDSNASSPAKLQFPTIEVPGEINAGTKPLLPEIYFSLFADQDIESVPSTSHIAASLLRDAVVDTINILDFNRNIVAKFLNEIDCFWAKDTFVKRSTTFDKLRELQDGRTTWKPEDVIIDAVFSQIFQLPQPEHRLVYYHSLITESCKISPAAIAPSLGRAIRFLFRNIDNMDMELSYRFMDWFAHHLSNFEFRWKWTEW